MNKKIILCLVTIIVLTGCTNSNQLKCVRETESSSNIKDEMIVKFKDGKPINFNMVTTISFEKNDNKALDNMFAQATIEAKDKQDQIPGSVATAVKKSNKVELKLEVDIEKSNKDLLSTIAFNPNNSKNQIKEELEKSNYKCK